jgi:hypothetical protein
MRDSEIENLLRRYHPVAPSPDLSARIFDDRVLRTWPWAAAAAALLAMALGVHAATNRLASRELTGAAEAGPTIDDLAAALGGGDEARRMAEQILLEQRARAEFAPPPPPAPSIPAGELR